jgi:hypothetical protein
MLFSLGEYAISKCILPRFACQIMLHLEIITSYWSSLGGGYRASLSLQPFPLVSSSRWLVKRGELTAYVEDTVLFSKRMSKQQVYFFLFNDVLIITKKKR